MRSKYQYLLELTIGSTVYRFAEKEVYLQYNGINVKFNIGLSNISISNVIGQDSSLKVSASLFPGSINISELISFGYNPLLFKAKMIGYNNEDDLINSKVIINGQIDSPVYGTKYEPFDFEIVSLQSSKSISLIQQSSNINKSTWPRNKTTSPYSFPSEIQGTIYPFIFGSPGKMKKSGIYISDNVNLPFGSLTSNSEILLPLFGPKIYPVETLPTLFDTFGNQVSTYDQTTIQNQLFLVAGHDLNNEITDIVVYDYSEDKYIEGISYSLLELQKVKDELGRTVSVLKIPYSKDFKVDPTHEYYMIFNGEKSSTYNVNDGLGSLLLFLCSMVPDGYDISSINDNKDLLNKIEASGWFQETSTISELIDKLISDLPVLKINGKNGIYFKLLDYKYDETKIKYSFKNKINCIREGSISFTPKDEIKNNFIFNYALSGDGKYWEKATITSEDNKNYKGSLDVSLNGGISLSVDYVFDLSQPITETNVLSSLCLQSQQIYGRRDLQINLPYVWNLGTIELLSENIVKKYCFPRRRITYSCDLSFDHLVPGDFIKITDEEIYINEQVCIIEQVEIQNDKMIIILEVMEK